MWANGGAACGRVVQLKSLATGAASFLDTPGGPLCEELEYSFLDTITLAGTRALWVTAHESLSSVYFTLFTAVPDGRRERKLGDLSLESDNPLLAPVPMAGDGSTLLFARRSSSSDDSFARSGVYRVREQARYVAGTEGVLDIAADGSRFALARRIAGGCVCNHSPFWSPDGKHIAFVSARAEGRRNQVFAMDADGARLQPLMDGGYFQWAPDGSALAGYSSDLAVVRPDGSDRRTLYRGHGGLFAWSPDARQLASPTATVSHSTSSLPRAGHPSISACRGTLPCGRPTPGVSPTYVLWVKSKPTAKRTFSSSLPRGAPSVILDLAEPPAGRPTPAASPTRERSPELE